MVYVYFFFFQAEDGIRDLTVTGVQTCALPIFPGDFSFGEASSGSPRRLDLTFATLPSLTGDLRGEREESLFSAGMSDFTRLTVSGASWFDLRALFGELFTGQGCCLSGTLLDPGDFGLSE